MRGPDQVMKNIVEARTSERTLGPFEANWRTERRMEKIGNMEEIIDSS